MDWDAADALDVVQALAAHFGFGFAEAVDFLLARQMQQAQNDDGEAQQLVAVVREALLPLHTPPEELAELDELEALDDAEAAGSAD